jgi:mRNA-degrading endonuclease toxin of MazEF toxin-antitoxin module
VILAEADGLLTACAANCDHLQTVPKAKLGAYIAHLSPKRMQELRAAISFALGFDAF